MSVVPSASEKLKLFLLIARDDDVTPAVTSIFAPDELSAVRTAIRRGLVPKEVLLGTSPYDAYQGEVDAPPPELGLTPAQEKAYIDAMSVEVFKLRLDATLEYWEATGHEAYHFQWLGEQEAIFRHDDPIDEADEEDE
jgi:hypothetical protein